MLVAFGQFPVRICWQQDSVLFDLPKWQITLSDDQLPSNYPVLRVREGNVPTRYFTHNGWNNDTQDPHLVVYVDESKPVFSIKYACDCDKVAVIVGVIVNEYAKMAIQYGVMLALNCSCVGFHGVTLLCGNEIIILSAPSGTGKTTLAKLLETYCEAIVLNGDFALLSVSEEGAYFEPTPFCGSSDRSLNHRVRINRVVFLEQSRVNRWQNISGREAVVRFMSNAFVPTWDHGIQHKVQENVIRCLQLITVNLFSFAPTQEAAEMFSNHLGDYEV